MTLDTRLRVHDPVEVTDLFHFIRGLLGADDTYQWVDKEQEDWKTKEPLGDWVIENLPGQGLPAWLMVYYRKDGPRRADSNACHEYCDPDEGYHYHRPAHWVEVSMDTAYGYRDEQGRGCGDLHASLVAQIGRWLDERGIDWSWENEFTSEIHTGRDKYERLKDLCSGGADATAWFQNIVMPAILQEVSNAH